MDELFLQRDMSPEQRQMFKYEMDTRRKSPDTALILSIFGLHYFYLGQVGLGLLLWATIFFGIGLIWAFIDIFRARGLANAHNAKVAQEVAARVCSMYASSPRAASPSSFCIHCGTANASQAKFCNACGQPQPAGA